MPFVVVYDACVLFPNTLRDLLIRVAMSGLVQAKWTDDFVLDQIGIDERRVWACMQQIADSRQNPPEDIEDVMGQLEDSGLIESMTYFWSSWTLYSTLARYVRECSDAACAGLPDYSSQVVLPSARARPRSSGTVVVSSQGVSYEGVRL